MESFRNFADVLDLVTEKMRTKKPIGIYLYVIALIAAISFFIYLWMPQQGDDLAYKGIFSGANPWYSYFYWPRFFARHWVKTNGRILDKLMPLLMNLPKGFLALLCSVALAYMYSLAVKVAGVARGALPYILIGSLWLLLPWWDSSNLFAVQVNYVWSSALLLGAWLLIFSTTKKFEGITKYLGYALCFSGGMVHEGASIPLVGGMAIYYFINGRNLPKINKNMFFAFITGVCCTLFSPALFLRATTHHTPDDTPIRLIIFSEPVVVCLWIIAIVLFIFKRSRESLIKFSHNPLSSFAFATLFGAPIILVSGIVGRSGWFVTLYALIAFVAYLSMFKIPRLAIVSWTISLAIIVQTCGLAIMQHSLWDEYKDFETKFLQSDNGAIYGDYTADDEIPAWALWRLRGVPDGDDVYLAECLSLYNRTDSVCPAIVSSKTLFFDTLPEEAEKLDAMFYEAWKYQQGEDDYVFQPLGEIFIGNRRVIDPGDSY